MALIRFDPRPAVFHNAWAEVMFVFLILCAQFLTQAALAMALSTLDIISDSFSSQTGKQITFAQQIWFPTSVSLTCGSFILISGRLGDLFGLKHVLVIGWFWISVWSLINGFLYYTKSVEFFIVCRAFTGIGFALSVPCGMGILGRVYPNGTRKHFVFGLLGACGPTGSSTGALLGAIFAKYVWWPWCFWVLAIFCFFFGICSILYIPDINNIKSWAEFKEIWPRFDWIGSVVGVVGLILLNFAVAQAPAAGWDSAYIIVCLIVSVALITIFFAIEVKFAPYPILPKSIYNVRLLLVLLIMTFGWGSFGIWLYIFWRLMLGLREYNPVVAAVATAPLVILGIGAALCTSFLFKHIKALYLISVSAVCFTAGSVMLAVTPVHQTYWRLTFGVQFILAWAMDISFPAASILMSNFLPQEHQGMGGSLINTTVNYSNAFFLALSLTVEHQIYTQTGSLLKSYRAAMYFGIGVAFLGILSAILFIISEHVGEQTHIKMESDSSIEVSKETKE